MEGLDRCSYTPPHQQTVRIKGFLASHCQSSLNQCIKSKTQKKQKKLKSRFLLSQYGKIDLERGIKTDLKFSRRKWSSYGAYLYLDSRLYFCGGSSTDKRGSFSLSNQCFFSDSDGRCASLASMRCHREDLSLGGANHFLLAAGGFDKRTTELFTITANKWLSVPDLNQTVLKPGVCILDCKRAFCFSGQSIEYMAQVVVQSIQLPRLNQNWQTLPVGANIGNLSRIGVFSLRGSLYLFGREGGLNRMFQLSEEGDFLKNSNDMIKKGVGFYPSLDYALVRQGKIYTMGEVTSRRKKWGFCLWQFDGSRWFKGI